MLAEKRVEIVRRMRDERWTTRDKSEQYRGILKLHDRDKKQKAQDAVNLKKKIACRLVSFRVDVRKYRNIVNDVAKGVTASHCRSLLQHRRDLQLQYRGKLGEDIYVSISQDNRLNRRRLDKLRYEKKKKMKRCFELQLEHAELTSQYAREQRLAISNPMKQRLITLYQQSRAKQNAAKAIQSTYASMLDILKEDAVYHETLLDSLKEEQRSQCNVIYKATIVGQLAAENTDDIGDRYKRLTRNVWENMKERERSLELVRGQVQDLWMYAQSLIRTESDTVFTQEHILSSRSRRKNGLEKQIRSLEAAFDKVKDSLLVRSYRELFTRLEEQTRQKTRLLAQFERNVKARDALLSEKNEALATLSSVEHSLVAEMEEYKVNKNMLLKQIATEKNRETEQKKLRKEQGELLMDIRGALQNMVAMLVCIRRGGKGAKKQPKRVEKRDRPRGTQDSDFDEFDEFPMIEKMETEGLALLSTVSRKVGALLGMSNFDLDEKREKRARDLYQTYVSNYCSKLKFEDLNAEPTGFFVEHETFDASVPTRTEIKLRSRQIVETHQKLQ